jgi:hypothetical protein
VRRAPGSERETAVTLSPQSGMDLHAVPDRLPHTGCETHSCNAGGSSPSRVRRGSRKEASQMSRETANG